MKRRLTVALCLTVGVALSGCGSKEPSGQVVATVGKQEITAIDLKNEMAGFSTPDPKVRRAAEARALDSIITRKILAQAAEKAKLDKSPEYVQQKQRLDEALLVQTWQGQLARAVPPPSREEIDAYIAAHPDYYGAHKTFVVDQIRMARPTSPKLLEQLKPLNTMAEVEQALSANGIKFARGMAQIDALVLPPDVLAQIMKLPPGEVFVLPANNLVYVSVIQETRVTPVTGQPATNHAQRLVRVTRTNEAVQREFGSALQQARKDVKYSKAYQPAPAKPPASKASASAATPAAKGN